MLGKTSHQSREPPLTLEISLKAAPCRLSALLPRSDHSPCRPALHFSAEQQALYLSVCLSPRPALKSSRATSLLHLEGCLTGSRKCLSQVRDCALLNNNGTLSNLAVFEQIWNYSKINFFKGGRVNCAVRNHHSCLTCHIRRHELLKSPALLFTTGDTRRPSFHTEQTCKGGFPGGSVVKNTPASAGRGPGFQP